MLRFSLPGKGIRRVRLEILDVRGRRVRTLVDEERAPGLHHVRWDGRDGAGRRVASGVYLVILEADGARRSRKILLLR